MTLKIKNIKKQKTTVIPNGPLLSHFVVKHYLLGISPKGGPTSHPITGEGV